MCVALEFGSPEAALLCSWCFGDENQSSFFIRVGLFWDNTGTARKIIIVAGFRWCEGNRGIAVCTCSCILRSISPAGFTCGVAPLGFHLALYLSLLMSTVGFFRLITYIVRGDFSLVLVHIEQCIVRGEFKPGYVLHVVLFLG